MNISKDNYEIFILDYYEGKLNKLEEQALFAFLEANPEIKSEFDSFENISLILDDSQTYAFKESLKKPVQTSISIINAQNYKEFFIANLEGDLSISQQKQLESFLKQYPHLKDEYKLFQLAKLSPDDTIVFKNKNQLKKFTILNIPIHKKLFYQTVSIAASLLIMASVATYYLSMDSIVNKNITAVNETTKASIHSYSTAIKKTVETKQTDNKSTSKHKNLTFQKEHLIIKMAQTLSMPLLKNNDLQLLASIQLEKIEINHSVTINEDKRDYYTAVNNQLAFSDEKQDEPSKEQITDKKTKTAFGFDENLLKKQGLAEAGGFLKNVAVLGFTKIEELGSSAKETYLALEEKLSRK